MICADSFYDFMGAKLVLLQEQEVIFLFFLYQAHFWFDLASINEDFHSHVLTTQKNSALTDDL